MTTSRQTRTRKVRLARERALHLYAAALERADLDTMAQVLRLAEDDPVLSRQLEELEEHDAASYPELALAEDTELVRGLLLRHLPSARAGEAEAPPPLTVGDVVGRMFAERKVPAEDQAASLPLRDHQAPVPAQLGRKDALRLGSALGVRLSERFWQLFREAALHLGLGHSRQAGFAAARRAARGAPAPKERERGDASAPGGPRKPAPGEGEGP